MSGRLRATKNIAPLGITYCTCSFAKRVIPQDFIFKTENCRLLTLLNPSLKLFFYTCNECSSLSANFYMKEAFEMDKKSFALFRSLANNDEVAPREKG